jgi:hypothetical protein
MFCFDMVFLPVSRYLWGGVAPADVGVVTGFRDHNTECGAVFLCRRFVRFVEIIKRPCSCIVDFPDHPGWLGLVDELEKADKPSVAECVLRCCL